MPNDSAEKPHQVIHFRPGQLAYLVTHQGQLTQDQLLALFRWSNTVSDKACLLPRRVLSFPATPPVRVEPEPGQPAPAQIDQRNPFSLIFADVQGVGDDTDQLLELIKKLDDARDRQPVDEITLERVSANWLASGGSQPGSTGGPGGKPTVFGGKVEDANKMAGFTVPASIKGQGKGVDVAILDTAPCLHDLADAYNNWCGENLWTQPSSQHPHALIRTLLGPQSPLRLYPASYEDLRRMGSIESDEHPYPMPDHGLFAAGIVHTIAPRATIHLVEVLNRYGIGDFESVTVGLQRVIDQIQRYPGRSVVVNCSFVLNLPIRTEQCHHDSETTIWTTYGRNWLEHQGDGLMYIADLVYALNSRVIAAAGNDRTGPGSVDARYPAAFPSALGVGALPRLGSEPPGLFTKADYSNVADKPESEGMTTLGGEEGAENGVLGIYLGEFPDHTSNETKWAWWAGTSFATPIISAVTAAVLSSMPPGSAARQAITTVRNAKSANPTDNNEAVLFVKQDQPL